MDLKRFIETKNEHQEKIDQLFIEHKEKKGFIDDYWDSRKQFYLEIQNKIDIKNIREIENRLRIKLPPSYIDFVTNIGVFKFGNDSYEMLAPNEIVTLSEALENEWEVSWSRENPKLKSHTDRIVIFSFGESSRQDYYYIGFDYRIEIDSNEIDLFYLCQDEIWNEENFSQMPSVIEMNTIDLFINLGFENAIEEAERLIECVLDDYD